MQNHKLKDFTNSYFTAESRANHNSQGGTQFLVKDKLHLVRSLINLFEDNVVSGASEMGIHLTEYETPGVHGDLRRIGKARHTYRLKRWLADYYSGSLGMDNAIAVKGQQSMNLVADNDVLLKRNLIDTVKGVCASALKNGLSDEDIQVILSSGHITAKEERKIQEVKLEFTKFLRDKGITKDVAMQLLD